MSDSSETAAMPASQMTFYRSTAALCLLVAILVGCGGQSSSEGEPSTTTFSDPNPCDVGDPQPGTNFKEVYSSYGYPTKEPPEFGRLWTYEYPVGARMCHMLVYFDENGRVTRSVSTRGKALPQPNTIRPFKIPADPRAADADLQLTMRTSPESNKVFGKAELTRLGPKRTRVTIRAGYPSTLNWHPFIETRGAPIIELTPIWERRSTTILPISLERLANGKHSICVHHGTLSSAGCAGHVVIPRGR